MKTPCLSRGLDISASSVSELSIEIRVTRAGREPFIYLRVMRLVLSSTVDCGSVVVTVELGSVLMCQRMLIASASQFRPLPKLWSARDLLALWFQLITASNTSAVASAQTKDPRTVKCEGLS